MRKCYVLLFGITVLITGFRQSNTIDSKHATQHDHYAGDTLQKDTIIRVAAKPGSGFNYAYYVFIPAGTTLNKQQYLLVETNNTGLNDTMQFHEDNAKLQALRKSSGSSVSRRLKIPFLVPVFPRSQKDRKVYTHALDRDAVLIRSGAIKRLDLQLIAMIRDANSALQPFKILLNEKVFLNGFSASGTFANRFTLIHPELVAAVACGGINAMPILPVNSFDGAKLNYPIGTNDFKSIFGYRPDLIVYKKVPQFIYMGGQDNNDAVLFDDAYSNKDRKIIYKVLGKTMLPDRWEKCVSVYATNAVNATFKTYPDMGHGTNGQMNGEIAEFFKKTIQQ